MKQNLAVRPQSLANSPQPKSQSLSLVRLEKVEILCKPNAFAQKLLGIFAFAFLILSLHPMPALSQSSGVQNPGLWRVSYSVNGSTPAGSYGGIIGRANSTASTFSVNGYFDWSPPLNIPTPPDKLIFAKVYSKAQLGIYGAAGLSNGFNDPVISYPSGASIDGLHLVKKRSDSLSQHVNVGKFTISANPLTLCLLAQTPKDFFCKPIGIEELQKSIRMAPLNSEDNISLIYHGTYSNLESTVFREYLAIQKKKPENGYALRWLANSALQSMFRISHEIEMGKWSKGKAIEEMQMRQLAEKSFRKALILLPKSGILRSEFGRFMYFDYQLFEQKATREEAFALLKEGVTLEPANLRTHERLGSVYVRKGFGHYDAAKAEIELLEALRLDPSYSTPYYDLAELYIFEKKYVKADQALKSYVYLTSDSIKKGGRSLTVFRKEIDAGLSQQ